MSYYHATSVAWTETGASIEVPAGATGFRVLSLSGSLGLEWRLPAVPQSGTDAYDYVMVPMTETAPEGYSDAEGMFRADGTDWCFWYITADE